MPYTFNPFTGTFDFTDGLNSSSDVQFNSIIITVSGAASTPGSSVTGSWFTGGTSTTTKPQVLIEPTGTSSTAWNTAGTGFGVNAAAGFTGNLADLKVGGTSQFYVTSSGNAIANRFEIPNTLQLYSPSTNRGAIGRFGVLALFFAPDQVSLNTNQHTSGFGFGPPLGADVFINRDAANTLAQRNGTNAQTTRIYNTFTSSTNFERAKIEWSSNVLRIGTEKGSAGGTARSMELQTDGTTRLTVDTVGSIQVATALTVATLPAAPVVGMVARVTDATAPVMGATVVGGGAAAALCWYNGANWTVIGI